MNGIIGFSWLLAYRATSTTPAQRDVGDYLAPNKQWLEAALSEHDSGVTDH
jgi:hypothetical protein